METQEAETERKQIKRYRGSDRWRQMKRKADTDTETGRQKERHREIERISFIHSKAFLVLIFSS